MAQVIAWPSPSDYSTAIQNPRHCFSDAELRAGSVAANRLGLPLGASGNFAVVYRVEGPARAFAVRCFIRTVTDQQQRYDALSRYLRGFRLPALVDFAYLPEGIRVRGHSYPLVRMEWIAGKQLHQYVNDALEQGPVLSRLAAQWRELVASLRRAHIAHGDLQHGNVLVDAAGRLRLVDYDGMFIPAWRGRPPGESGHPNYQHPERVERGYYEENADAFSDLVIYLSLLAVKADPRLWTFHTGENLIFVAEDYGAPGQTPIWGRLLASPDAEVRRLTGALEGFCRRPVALLPDLEMVAQDVPRPVAKTANRAPATSMARSAVPAPTGTPALQPPATVHCAKCGRANSADSIYCQSCTHQLCGNRFCSHCGRSIPVKSRYCPECGAKL